MIANSLTVPFKVDSEKATRDAFSRFAAQQGYKIIRSRDPYPDYRLELPSGETVDVEAEHYASGFWGHDPNEADMIVCWERDVPVMPLPTIELRRYITAQNSGSGWFFASVFDPGIHIKTLEVGYDEADDEYRLRFRWFKREQGRLYHRGTKKPELNGKQLRGLLESMDDSFRRQFFVDNFAAGYDQLKEWHDSYPPSELPYSHFDGRIIGAIKSPISDGPLVWRLQGGLKLSARNASNSPEQRFNTTADLPESAFITLLGQLPKSVREAVFVDGDLKTLYDWVRYDE